MKRTVLVFSNDPLTSALVGAASDLVGFPPVFANEYESPRDALMRTRPAIILVDCDHDGACAEPLFAQALMAGARVAVFSSARSKRQIEPIAREFNVRYFTLPMDFDTFSKILDACAADT